MDFSQYSDEELQAIVNRANGRAEEQQANAQNVVQPAPQMQTPTQDAQPGPQAYEPPAQNPVEPVTPRTRQLTEDEIAEQSRNAAIKTFLGSFWGQGRKDAMDEYRKTTRDGGVGGAVLGYLSDLGNSFWSGLAGGGAKIAKAVGTVTGSDGLVRGAENFEKGVREYLPTDMTDTAAVDANGNPRRQTWGQKIAETGKGVVGMAGEFAPAAIGGPVAAAYNVANITAGGINRAKELYDVAKANGASEAKAKTLAVAGGAIDAFQNAFLMRTFARRGSVPIEEKFFKSFIARQLAGAAKVSGAMGVGGGAQDALNQMAENGSFDIKRTGNAIVDSAIEGAMFHVMNTALHAPVKWSESRTALRRRAADLVRANREFEDIGNSLAGEKEGVLMDEYAKSNGFGSAQEMENAVEASRRVLGDDQGAAAFMASNPDMTVDIISARRRGENVDLAALQDEGVNGIGNLRHAFQTQEDANAFGDRLLEYSDNRNAANRLKEARERGEAVQNGQSVEQYTAENDRRALAENRAEEEDLLRNGDARYRGFEDPVTRRNVDAANAENRNEETNIQREHRWADESMRAVNDAYVENNPEAYRAWLAEKGYGDDAQSRDLYRQQSDEFLKRYEGGKEAERARADWETREARRESAEDRLSEMQRERAERVQGEADSERSDARKRDVEVALKRDELTRKRNDRIAAKREADVRAADESRVAQDVTEERDRADELKAMREADKGRDKALREEVAEDAAIQREEQANADAQDRATAEDAARYDAEQSDVATRFRKANGIPDYDAWRGSKADTRAMRWAYNDMVKRAVRKAVDAGDPVARRVRAEMERNAVQGEFDFTGTSEAMSAEAKPVAETKKETRNAQEENAAEAPRAEEADAASDAEAPARPVEGNGRGSVREEGPRSRADRVDADEGTPNGREADAEGRGDGRPDAVESIRSAKTRDDMDKALDAVKPGDPNFDAAMKEYERRSALFDFADDLAENGGKIRKGNFNGDDAQDIVDLIKEGKNLPDAILKDKDALRKAEELLDSMGRPTASRDTQKSAPESAPRETPTTTEANREGAATGKEGASGEAVDLAALGKEAEAASKRLKSYAALGDDALREYRAKLVRAKRDAMVRDVDTLLKYRAESRKAEPNEGDGRYRGNVEESDKTLYSRRLSEKAEDYPDETRRAAERVAKTAPGLKVELRDFTDAEKAAGADNAGASYDPRTNTVVLPKDASLDDLSHEVGWHATLKYARENNPELFRKMMQYAAEAPKDVRDAVYRAYPEKRFSGSLLLDEIGAARYTREHGGDLARALRSEANRTWFRRTVDAVRDAWRRMAGKNGYDLRNIDGMAPEEAISHLAREFVAGRELKADMAMQRAVRKYSEAVRTGDADTIRKYIGETSPESLPESGLAKAGEEGNDDSIQVEGADGVRYSVKSMTKDVSDGVMEAELVRTKVYNKKNAKAFVAKVNELVDEVVRYGTMFDLGETFEKGDRNFKSYKPNSDPLYKKSLDFSTLCKKRIVTQAIIDKLQTQVKGDFLSREEQIAVRDMLKEYQKQEKALQVACHLCYVEAARLKAPEQQKRLFASKDTMRSEFVNYLAQKSKAFKADIKEMQRRWRVDNGYPADATKDQIDKLHDMRVKAGEKDVARVDDLNKATKEFRTGNYRPTEQEEAIIKRFIDMGREPFLDSNKVMAMASTDKTIYDFYSTYVRNATKSKGLEPNSPYYFGDSEELSDGFIRKMNRQGTGIRHQSWSDFQLSHMLDTVSALADLATRGAKMHAYTKVGDMIRIFGKSNTMFNMSLIPDAKDGFSKVEGMDIAEARELRDRFPDTAGTIAVAKDHRNLVSLLNNREVDYVIPYHSSGMPIDVRRMAGIGEWFDYQDMQKASSNKEISKPQDAKGWHKEPNIYRLVKESGLKGYAAMEAAAKRYAQLCNERGLKPKFADVPELFMKGSDGRYLLKNNNYWKTLVDHKMVNQKTGELIRQKAVRPEFDMDEARAAMKREYDAYDPGVADRAYEFVKDRFDGIGERIGELKENGPDDGDGVRYSRVTDRNRIENFEKARREGRTIKTIRSFVEVDGKLYSPMASMEKGADGKYRLGEPVGEIKDGKFVGYLQKADERPDLAVWDDSSKSYKFVLKKEGKVVGKDGKPVISAKSGKEIDQSDITALYNPYWHSSNSALNDQFTSAYKRPNLVTVECEILADEAAPGVNFKTLEYDAKTKLKKEGVTAKSVGKEEFQRRIDEMVQEARGGHDGSYWAEKANASVGKHDWHTGTVAKDLPEGERRSVYLTRELMPVRVMSTEEAADKIISQLGKNLNKSGPYNAQVFPPHLARALEERGMKLEHGVDKDGIRYSRRTDKPYDERTEDGRRFNKKYAGVANSGTGFGRAAVDKLGAVGRELDAALSARRADAGEAQDSLLRYSRTRVGSREDMERDIKAHEKMRFGSGKTRESGMESLAVVRDGDSVYKYRNETIGVENAYSNAARHNELFGDRTPYEIVDYAEGRDGSIVVLRQPYIDLVPKSGNLARKQLEADLRRRFGNVEVSKDGTEMRAGGWLIDDLKDENIGIDRKTGKYAVVDALIRRDEDYGGKPPKMDADGEGEKGTGAVIGDEAGGGADMAKAGKEMMNSLRGGTDSDTRYSRRAKLPSGQRSVDEKESWKDRLRRAVQDNMIGWRNAQDETGGVKDVVDNNGHTDFRKSTDYYEARDRQNGYEEKDMRALQNTRDGIDEVLVDADVSNEDFGKYLALRHAEERNRAIARKNGDTFDMDYDVGAGISSRRAEQMLNAMLADPAKAAALDKAGKMYDAMTRADLDRRLASGRISQEDYDRLSQYKHYAPLRRDMSDGELGMFNSSTSGFKENEFRGAKGLGSDKLFDANGNLTVNPYEFALLQAQEGIRGSLENESRLVLKNLVEHAAREGNALGEIVDGAPMPRGMGYTFTFADGSKAIADSGYNLAGNHRDIVLFKEGGKLKAIRFDAGEHGNGLKLADAANGKDMVKWHKAMSWMPWLTRKMAAMRTQYVPTFIARNMKADALEAVTAAMGRYGVKDAAGIAKDMAKATVSNFKELKDFVRTGKATGYVKEAVDGGLLTKGGTASHGFAEIEQSVKNHRAKIERERAGFMKLGLKDKAKRILDWAGDTIGDANELAELNTRISLFTALRKRNVPVNEAIKFCRDATTNFNRHGWLTPYINGAFMFSNAATQGMTRNIQALKDVHGRQLVGALVVLGTAEALVNHFYGNDDEREENGQGNARNLSEYEKKHQIGIPIGNGKQAIWQTRGLYATVPYLARTAVDAMLGETKVSDAMMNVLAEAGDILTEPLSGNGVSSKATAMQSLSPTLVDPLVQWVSGKDYKGDDRIAKSMNDQKPLSWNGKGKTSGGYKWFAKLLNSVTGGNEGRKGLVDMAPEDVQLIVETIWGGVGRDISQIGSGIETVNQLRKGESPERVLGETAFVRDWVREYPKIGNRYYQAVDKVKAAKYELGTKKTAEERADFIRENGIAATQRMERLGKMEKTIKEYQALGRGQSKTKGGKFVDNPNISAESKRKFHQLAEKLMAKYVQEVEG